MASVGAVEEGIMKVDVCNGIVACERLRQGGDGLDKGEAAVIFIYAIHHDFVGEFSCNKEECSVLGEEHVSGACFQWGFLEGGGVERVCCIVEDAVQS